MEYIVNNHKYKEIQAFHYGGDKPKIQFFTSKKYFIKEYSIQENHKSGPDRIIDFYTNYYDPQIFKAPKLIEYQITANAAKFVFENIGTENFKLTLLKQQFNKNDGRKVFKSILKTLLPFEQKEITHGDVRLHNLALKNGEVFLLDYDHFGSGKDNFPLSITNFLYNFNNAYTTKKVAGLKKTHDFTKIPINNFHPCCQDIAKAIISGEASSIQDMLDLMQ